MSSLRKKRCATCAEKCDRSGEVPLGLFRQAMELQFHMLDIPECYGGLGLDKISAGALLEEMAKADADLPLPSPQAVWD